MKIGHVSRIVDIGTNLMTHNNSQLVKKSWRLLTAVDFHRGASELFILTVKWWVIERSTPTTTAIIQIRVQPKPIGPADNEL